MLLPGSFKTTYETLVPTLEKGVDYLRSRLNAELAELRPVTIQIRYKSAESLYAKLQRGEAHSLFEIDDLIAARAVFLHTADLRTAMETVKRVLTPLEEKNVEAGKPTDFRYQQPHLIAYLPSDYLARHPDLAPIKVEVQFTTYVQHALQESTHDVIYKGQKFSWREHRLDARLRGLLEIVDDVLENLSSVANVDAEPAYPSFDIRNAIVEAAKQSVPAHEMPDDMRRFAITAEGILAAAGIDPSELPALLAEHADISNALSLTLIDKVLGVALRKNAGQLLSKSKARLFLVTPELETAVEEAQRIPSNRRVQLTPSSEASSSAVEPETDEGPP